MPISTLDSINGSFYSLYYHSECFAQPYSSEFVQKTDVLKYELWCLADYLHLKIY